MIKSVEKAFRLVEILSQADRPMRLRDVAQAAGISQSNAFRMLQTLRALGYTRQTEDGARHELTLKVFEVGARRVHNDNLLTVARPVLKNLAGQVEHNVMLSVRDGLDGVVVDRIESRSPVRAFAYLGARVPLHSYSGGKALLAHAPVEVVDKVCANLWPLAANTITDPDALRADLERTRARGYALALRESNDSNSAVAVIVRQRRGLSHAALSIAGPGEDFTEDLIASYASRLRDCAARIEAEWVDGL